MDSVSWKVVAAVLVPLMAFIGIIIQVMRWDRDENHTKREALRSEIVLVWEFVVGMDGRLRRVEQGHVAISCSVFPKACLKHQINPEP